jgi:hypothetical protein
MEQRHWAILDVTWLVFEQHLFQLQEYPLRTNHLKITNVLVILINKKILH